MYVQSIFHIWYRTDQDKINSVDSKIHKGRCLAPMVWAFLSTSVQLPATQRKVEGGERDIQVIHVNEANSCLARGYCV